MKHQIRQAVEAPEGALKDRYDLLLRPCVDGIDRVHRCTYDAYDYMFTDS